MDLFDWFFAPTWAEGTKKMRIFAGIVTALLGGLLGFVYGSFIIKTSGAVFTYTVGGAAVGALIGVIFPALIISALVGVVIFAAVIGWSMIKGEI